MKFVVKQKRIVIVISIFILLFQLVLSMAYGQRKSKFRKSQFQSGDAIEIEIIDIMAFQGNIGADLSRINDEYTIARDGTIFLPLVGDLKVTGHDKESLVELLNEKLSPYFKEPFIIITPLIRLTLLGAFNKPGSYRIDPGESLWELIDMASGPEDDCDLNSIRVIRGGKIVISNLLLSFEKGHSLTEIGVRSGDQIIANSKRKFGVKEVLDWVKFGVTLIVLYFQIEKRAK